MQSEGSSQCPKDRFKGHYPESDESIPQQQQISFKIICSLMPSPVATRVGITR
jgi:hypothetical protein